MPTAYTGPVRLYCKTGRRIRFADWNAPDLGQSDEEKGLTTVRYYNVEDAPSSVSGSDTEEKTPEQPTTFNRSASAWVPPSVRRRLEQERSAQEEKVAVQQDEETLSDEENYSSDEEWNEEDEDTLSDGDADSSDEEWNEEDSGEEEDDETLDTLATFATHRSKMDAIKIQRIFRGYWCRRKHMGQQLCNRISELCIEFGVQKKYYDPNVISPIFDDLGFVRREIESHGPFGAYGIYVPSSMPGLGFLQELSPFERFGAFSEILNWITEEFIPAYKERADKRVQHQNHRIECYENKVGPLVPAAPGLSDLEEDDLEGIDEANIVSGPRRVTSPERFDQMTFLPGANNGHCAGRPVDTGESIELIR